MYMGFLIYQISYIADNTIAKKEVASRNDIVLIVEPVGNVSDEICDNSVKELR